MSEPDLTSGADRNPIEVVAEEFVERRRRGECPAFSEYTRRYPELADAITITARPEHGGSGLGA
jgi:hypothetical protein